MSKNRLVILILALALVIAVGFWYFKIFLPQGEVITQKDNAIETTSQRVNNELVDTTNWKTYRNEEFGFEFKYPNNITMNDCTSKIEGSYVYFIMRYANDNFDWCDAPGTAIPHSIYVELSSFMTKKDLTQTISSIEKKSIEFNKDTKDNSIYLQYVFYAKDDEDNIVEPKINIFNKRAFIMAQDDLYISIGLIYREKEIDAELKQKYGLAIDEILASFKKID